MLSAAENSPIVPMNSSTGIPLSSWTFLKASSDICVFCADPAWAPACVYEGAPHAAPTTTAGSVLLFEVLEEAAAFFVERPDDACAGVDMPVPRVANATPISHTNAAAVTAILIRLDPICMMSPLLGLMSLDPDPRAGLCVARIIRTCEI